MESRPFYLGATWQSTRQEPRLQLLQEGKAQAWAWRFDGKSTGLTLSRIPLGLYVWEVDEDGEAFAAGVISGLVLVDSNGLGVLVRDIS
mmetsp:Transcript_17704/g.51529  ORF Transcript_17704/g.51529 Transcript_17704/m.51529 type:complete len:89 (+) Transcript_17704:65-331(+)